MIYVLLVLLVSLAVVFGNAIFARLGLLEAQVKRLEAQRAVTVTTLSTPTPTYHAVTIPVEHPQRKPAAKRSRKKAS